jgi:hypothetical protein
MKGEIKWVQIKFYPINMGITLKNFTYLMIGRLITVLHNLLYNLFTVSNGNINSLPA